MPSLESLQLKDRQALYSLASLDTGATSDSIRHLDWVWRAFETQLMPTFPGSSRQVLRSPLDRQTIQASLRGVVTCTEL